MGASATSRPTQFDDVLEVVRSICGSLPEATAVEAWVGIRWEVRKKNFVQIVDIQDGRPPVFAREAGSDGPLCVLMLRCPLDEVESYRRNGHPYFVPPWFANLIGVRIDEQTDWKELGELIIDSYRVCAPKRLVQKFDDLLPVPPTEL